MYDDSGKPPLGSSIFLIIMIILVIIVMGVTVALNGGTSTAPVEENVADDTNVTENQTAAEYQLLGNSTYGTVTKSSGYGNPSSDIHVAFILGVNANQKTQNAIVPTIQNENNLKYCYDVYIVNAVDGTSGNGDENNENNLTVNEISESLVSEYVLPDVLNNNYNFTVDVHSTNDSNSYLFVPSENTVTSKTVMSDISNKTDVGIYTPDTHTYTEYVSEPIISYEIPSIVYVTKDYYSNATSTEISSIIHAIDDFDFKAFFSPVVSNNTTDEVSSATSDSSNSSDVNTITVTNTSGSKEVD